VFVRSKIPLAGIRGYDDAATGLAIVRDADASSKSR
jgi:hypothetical protein